MSQKIIKHQPIDVHVLLGMKLHEQDLKGKQPCMYADIEHLYRSIVLVLSSIFYFKGTMVEVQTIVFQRKNSINKIKHAFEGKTLTSRIFPVLKAGLAMLRNRLQRSPRAKNM